MLVGVSGVDVAFHCHLLNCFYLLASIFVFVFVITCWKDMLETMKKNCADGIAELGHHAAESPHTPSPLNNFDEDSLELLSSVALSDTSPSPPKSQSSTTSTATATHHRDNSS
eukprot:m.10949 g.10949  ORF g.10949 m.10949 type:complete len:113 (+) comp6772_c0_seq1:886-1224(+)